MNGEEQSKDENKSVDFLNNILKTWKDGNAREFEKYFEPSKEGNDKLTKDFNKKFWYERDKHMAEKIIKYLADKNNRTYFVVVGAGHLIGKDGVINSIKKQGYTLEQVK